MSASLVVDPVPPAPRWLQWVAGVSLVISVFSAQYVAAIMEAVGLLGGWINLMLFFPLIAVGIWSLRRETFWGGSQWVLALFALFVVRALLGDHFLSGLSRSFALSIVFFWWVLLRRYPDLLDVLTEVGMVSMIVMFGLYLLLPGQVGLSPNPILILCVFYRWIRPSKRPWARSAMVGVGRTLFAILLLVLSTFRSPVLAVVAGCAVVALRLREARWTLILGGLFAAVVLMAAPRQQSVSYGREIDRNNIVERYEGAGDDRLSGRGDYWENAIELMIERPEVWLWGVGPSETDYFMAEANPQVLYYTRGERAVHTHNLLLELIIGMGFLGPLLLFLWIVQVLARVPWTSPTMGLFVAVLVMNTGNVLIFDTSGGALVFAAFMVMSDRKWFDRVFPARLPVGVNPIAGATR